MYCAMKGAQTWSPAPIIERLDAELGDVFKSDEERSRFADQGAIPGLGSAANLASRALGTGTLCAHLSACQYPGVRTAEAGQAPASPPSWPTRGCTLTQSAAE